MEVLHGAEIMLRQRRINVIFLEITFSEMYKDLPGLNRIYKFMTEMGLSLVAFHGFHYQNNRLGWCDAMFAVHP